jgi:lipopolysaccharide transport system ATP-binding protein
MSETLVKVENVSKKFCRNLKLSLWYGMKDLGNELLGRSHNGAGKLRKDDFWAVNDISFELKRGDCLGLIGRNGAGKTTLLRMLNGLIKPDRGRIEMRGRVGALIALGAGFNPVLTGRENIYVNAAVLGLTKDETDAKFEKIVEFAELGEFIDSPVQSYSSGMTVRLGFAVATALEPDVLLLDEVLAVGDVGFRHKCHNRIIELTKKCAVIVVSHSMPNLTRISTDILLINKGEKIYLGKNISKGVEKYCDQFPSENTKVIGKENIVLNNCKAHGRSNNSDTIKYRDDLVIDLEFSFLKEKCADVLCIEIFDAESKFIAESFIDLPVAHITEKKSVNITSLIPQIQLRSGRYSLTIIFCKKINGIPNGEFITQYRSVTEFNIKGSLTVSHAPFLLPAKIIKVG